MKEFFKSHVSNSIFWSAVGHGDRITVISECERIIDNYGFIMEFKKFSDLALSLYIDVESNKIPRLYEALKSVLNLDVFDFKEVNEKTHTIFLNISFADGHGDLKQEIPNVPG